MPPVRMRGDGRMARDPKKTLLRILSYLKKYAGVLAVVVACIFVTAFATTAGSTALGKLVDNFILPMVAEGSTDFQPLWNFIVQIACIFVIGIAALLLDGLIVLITKLVTPWVGKD